MMVRTLTKSKATLSELVELASQGQEVLITVRGRVKARLVAAGPREGDDSSVRQWIDRLADLRKRYSAGNPSSSTEAVLEELREDRL